MVSRVKILPVFSILPIIFTIVFGKLCYKCSFSSNLSPCKDFDNKVLVADLALVPLEGEEEGEGAVGFSGVLSLKEELGEGYEIAFEAVQFTEQGDQLVMSSVMDLCSSLKDEDAPWYAAMEAFQTTACPLTVGDYEAKDLVVSMDFADGILNHEFVGEYGIQLAVNKGVDKAMCYFLNVAIEEFEGDACPEDDDDEEAE